MSAAEEKTPLRKDPEGIVVEQKEEHYDEIAGYKVGHAGVPVVLIVLYLLIILWALVAWIPPKGTY